MVIRIWVRFMKKGVSICFGGGAGWEFASPGGQPQPASRRVGHSLWLSVGCHVLVCHGADA